jgi:hypothetical protein
MLNKKSWKGIPVITLVLGIVILGCAAVSSELNGTWVFQDMTLKQAAGSELMKIMVSFIEQIPGLSVEQRKEVMAELRGMSDSEIRQLLEYGIESSRQMLKDTEMKLDNGKFEVSIQGVLSSTGTYSVRGNKMRQKTTHINGGSFGAMGREIGVDFSNFGIESKIYPIKEFKKLLEDIDPMFSAILDNPMFSNQTQEYSINGGTLTLTNNFGTAVYTKNN